MPSKVYLRTFGCKANWSDSQALESQAIAHGAVSTEHPLDADLLVVNTCAVTNEAEKQAQKWIQKQQAVQPEKQIWVTGCAAEVDPEKWANLGGNVQVFGNQDKSDFSKWLQGKQESPILGKVAAYTAFRSQHPIDREWSEPDGCFQSDVHTMMDQTARARAYLKVQEGCNVFCTYCIIPYGRGPSRSLSPEKVIVQLSVLLDAGVKEVILTATNLGVYGKEMGLSLDYLLSMAFQKKTPRIRLTSLNPLEVTPLIMHSLEQGNICPHLHLSIQSTETSILRRMKRGYERRDVENCLSAIGNLQTPEPLFIGMDLITGFPGETEANFEATLSFLEKNPTWTRLHVFPYSERSRTPATRLPNSVPFSQRKLRARRLMELSFQRLHHWYTTHFSPGTKIKGVLFDRKSKGSQLFGVTAGYARVAYAGSLLASRDLGTLTVESVLGDKQKGEVYLICK